MAKIKEAHFFPETGLSIVGIDSRYGTFYGSAKKHPDDPNFTSRFFGCQIAETRASYKELLQRIRIKKIELKTMEQYYNTIQRMRNYKQNSAEAHHARTMIRIYKNDLTELMDLKHGYNLFFEKLREDPDTQGNND